MKFIMTAESSPANFQEWNSDFIDGTIFEASSLDEAQDYLNEQCRRAGTDTDPYYDQFGPIAKEYIEDNE